MQRIERFPAEEIKTQISPPCQAGIFPHELEKDEQLSTIFIAEHRKSDDQIAIVHLVRNITHNILQQLNSSQ